MIHVDILRVLIRTQEGQGKLRAMSIMTDRILFLTIEWGSSSAIIFFLVFEIHPRPSSEHGIDRIGRGGKQKQQNETK